MLALACQIVSRDIKLAMRRKSELFAPLVFFITGAALFPLAVGPEREVLRIISPGVIWVTALLASTLTLNGLFASDMEDGTLEQMLLSPEPLTIIVLARCVAHTVLVGLPLLTVSPLLALQFGLGAWPTLVLATAFTLGMPVISLIGAIGAALTLNVRGGGALLTILVLPLYIPVLILGTGVVNAAIVGAELAPYFMLLGALCLAAFSLTPWAVAAALRIAID